MRRAIVSSIASIAALILALAASSTARAAVTTLNLTFDLDQGFVFGGPLNSVYQSADQSVTPFAIQNGDVLVVNFNFLSGQGLKYTSDETENLQFEIFPSCGGCGIDSSNTLVFTGFVGDLNSTTFTMEGGSSGTFIPNITGNFTDTMVTVTGGTVTSTVNSGLPSPIILSSIRLKAVTCCTGSGAMSVVNAAELAAMIPPVDTIATSSNWYAAFNRAKNQHDELNHMYHTGVDLPDPSAERDRTLAKAADMGVVRMVVGLAPSLGADNPQCAIGNEQMRTWEDANSNDAVDGGELSQVFCTNRTENNHGLGITVVIDHGNALYTLYGHLAAVKKEIWDVISTGGTYPVTRGDFIGVVGESRYDTLTDGPGGAIEPHVHFEVKDSLTLQDPFAEQYTGYTPDLPDAYGYHDPFLYVYPPPPFSNTLQIVKVIGQEGPAPPAGRGVRVYTGPGVKYAVLGWTGLNQLFVANAIALSNANGDSVIRLWYRIDLPNRPGPKPTYGWIVSETKAGAPLVEPQSSGAIVTVINDDSVGWRLRRDPTVDCTVDSNCVRVWDDLAALSGRDPYARVHAWDDSRFVSLGTQFAGGQTWHKIDIPKFYFVNPETGCPAPQPFQDQCVGDIDTVWLSEEALSTSVDRADQSIFHRSLGKCAGDAGFMPGTDYNGNGCTDFDDYRTWLGFYTPPPPCVVNCEPNEPTRSLLSTPPLSITTTSLPSATVGEFYATNLSATGGKEPYSWVIVSGSLAPGLSLSPEGLISGTLTTAGTYGFTVEVTDSSPRQKTISTTLSIEVTSSGTFIVTKTADTSDGVCDGDCSLREAIIVANATPGKNTILIPADTYTLSIAGTGEDAAVTGDLDITDDVDLLGAGAATTVIDGGGIDRVFDITGFTMPTVSISDVTIQNGDVSLSGSFGGGVSNGFATLTVTNSTIRNNEAANYGGVSNVGTMTLSGVTISGNTATGVGGGGGIGNTGTMALTNTTISGNTASGGSAIVNGTSTSITLTNVTISDNQSFGGIGASAITHVGGTFQILNTIIANNAGSNCLGLAIFSLGHNLEDGNTCFLTGTGDLPNTNPLLGALQDNGGPTLTHALLAGSPAIDAGSNIGCPTTDQRGVARPQGTACDIGAYEF
jgi:CSLREA domain-containing protein